jgi:YebC/PmpR family DNA-binding regulatory protein
MAGHSKWRQIKHKKETTDQKRGQVFSKLLKAIQAAVGAEPNPDFNPRLRSAVLKAKQENVPQENIERAIKKAKEEPTEELIIEAYGPAGAAFIIEALADNKNRALSEIKNTLGDFEARLASPGSVLWLFETDSKMERQPKFKQPLSPEAREKVEALLRSLQEKDEVISVRTNADL